MKLLFGKKSINTGVGGGVLGDGYVKKDDINIEYDQNQNQIYLNVDQNRISTIQLPRTGGLTSEIKNAMLAFCKSVASATSSTKTAADAMRATIVNMEEFSKLGTGLFIHWGVYSVPAGRYTGEKQPGGTSTTNISYNCEWSMRDLAIPRSIYKDYEKEFNTTNFDADAIVKKASEAGMGYVILTVKHHEGFSLYPTAFGNWDVRTAGKPGAECRTTIVQELKTACQKYGLKFGLYFSQYWDWMAEGGFGIEHGNKWKGNTTDEFTQAQHVAYCKRTIKQLEEIYTLFSPYILWWDPGSSVAASSVYANMFKECLDTTLATCIHNDRLLYDRSYGGDYGTGERTIYLRNAFKYGEACFTMNGTWGYSVNNEKDSSYYSHELVFKQFIIYSLAHGQNCLMNIGPRNDGSVPERQLALLTTMKNFADKYGSFSGYERINYYSMPKWGYMLKFDNSIVCYIFTKNNTGYESIDLDCVPTTSLESVEILTPGTSPSYTIGTNKVSIRGLALDPTTKIGVVRLNYTTQPMCEDANLMKASQFLPSRTCLMKSSNQSYDFTNLRFNLTPSKHVEHVTDIIWDDISEDYNVTLQYTTETDGDDTYQLTVLDITDGTTTTTLSYSHGDTTSSEKVHLENGHRYRLTFKVTGTNTSAIFKWDSLSFVNQSIRVTGVTLNHSSYTLDHDGTVTLFANIEPSSASNKSVIWTIGNEGVATISNGLITAVTAGETDVTVTTVDGGFTDTCHITVNAAPGEEIIHATGITLTEHSLSLLMNTSHTLQYQIEPSNATYSSVEWTSSNPDVATVTDGCIECLVEGSTTITVTTVDGGYSDSCNLTVTAIRVEGISLDKSTYNTIPGYGIQLNPTITPSNAYNQNITWTSDNETLATVDSQGNVVPQAPGTVHITAKTEDGNYTASCEFTIAEETYDYIWAHDSLDGTEGEDVMINSTAFEPFSDDNQHWTIFSFAQNSKNPTEDKNATLYQCVVDSSPWSGLRVDADNASALITGTAPACLCPRFVAGMDIYFNTEHSVAIPSSSRESNPFAHKHPFAFSRDGDTYKFSFDGVTWTTIQSNTPYGLESDTVIGRNVDANQIKRLKDQNQNLTVGYDYKRSSGTKTTTIYRRLKSDYPTCVAIKLQSDYKFHTLYNQYENTLITTSEE